jgi:hypothetical protein
MQFLTPAEWQEWCVQQGVGLRLAGWVRPSIGEEQYHVAKVPYPTDSGRKVFLARQLLALVAFEGEALLLVDDWAVWPSSQHLPLFTRFREALGERRPLIEAPGHLIDAADAEDAEDAVSIVAMSLLFFWDCYGIARTGRDAFYISHDEFLFVASRDAAVAERLAEELAP